MASAGLHESNLANDLSKLDLKADEVDRLKECLKQKDFRDMLVDYAKEISDPKNRQLYEEEIAKLEKERGVDVKFVKPEPGHVIKITNTMEDGSEQKCFVNICTNEHIAKPTNKPSEQDGKRGVQWSIPHSVSQLREDKDKAGDSCVVVDCVFHPDTYYLLKKNDRFKVMIHDTALDAVERQHKLNLNRSSIKQPKLKFKGQVTSSVIRSPVEGEEEKSKVFKQDPLKPTMPPVERSSNKQLSKPASQKPPPKQTNKGRKSSKKEKKTERSVRTRTATFEQGVKVELEEILGLDEMEKSDYIEPEYTITHRGYSDIQNFSNSMNGPEVTSTRPKELIVAIDLPLLRSASGLKLEIHEERILVECENPAAYKLNLKLPYAIDDNKGHAKFDKSKRKLTLTLEVLPPPGERGFTGFMIVSQEMKDACNSCVQDEMSRIAESLSSADVDTDEDDSSSEEEPDEKPKEEVHIIKSYKPSDHPSGLIHGGLYCLHEKHGDLWGKDFEKDWYAAFEADTSNPKLGELKHVSRGLIKFVEEMDNKKYVRRRPSMRFHQDEAFIVIIISVKSIDTNTLWYNVRATMLQLCCTSTCTDAKWNNSIFQVWVKWEKALIDPRRSRVDITAGNAVFVLRKHISSWKEWQNLKIGFDEKHCQVRTFATRDNVDAMLRKVQETTAEAMSASVDCEVIADDEEVDLFAVRLQERENQKQKDDKNNNYVNESSSKQLNKESKIPNDIIEKPIKTPEKLDQNVSDTSDKQPVNQKTVAKENGVEKINSSEKVADKSINDESNILQENVQPIPEADDMAIHEAVESQASESEGNNKASETKKHVSFVDEPQAVESDDDSDDNCEEIIKKSAPVEGIVTVANAKGDVEEMIMNHQTESAVKLENKALYELDDDL